MEKENKTQQNRETTNMKKIILTALAATFISALFCQHSQAAFITGDIQFIGSVKFDTTSLATATKAVAYKGVVVAPAGTSGSFTSVADGTAVTMAVPWIFNPSTPTPALWTVGGFTFDLTSSAIVTQTTMFLTVTGTGILSGNGFTPTPGTWTFSTQDSSGVPKANFSFSSDTSATAVPDGGSAVALLGIALAGIEGARRLIVRTHKA